MNSFLVFGETGQLGRELTKHGNVSSLGRDLADFTDPCGPVRHIEDSEMNAVIIAAAYTSVDKAEEEEALATTINAETARAIAQACAARGLPVVYVSTDYVFDGRGETPFTTNHPTAPLGAYGRSKLAGEKAVRSAGGVHAILRTSWVVSSHGNNFVKTMLRLGAERDQLAIVADQIGGPTCAAMIADTCLSIAGQLINDPTKSGTYHFSGGPDVSWADFAREIFAQSGTACEVVDIPTSDYSTSAARPLNSRLDNTNTQAVFGIARSDWRVGLNDILTDLGALRS